MKKLQISRRTFLQGAGVSIALPFLDAMMPWVEKAAAQSVSPSRLIVLYKPNGHYPDSWKVTSLAQLPPILQPLDLLKGEVSFVQGLDNTASRRYDDGHAPRLSCFLTGGPITASTSTVSAPKSIDQRLADARGTKALTLAGPGTYGTDNGFNGEYFSSLSWVGPRAAPQIKSPRVLFDQLFAGSGTSVPLPSTISKVYRKSIIDYVRGGATAKLSTLGKTDKAKLDEYLTGIREIELEMNKLEGEVRQCTADLGRPADNNIFEIHTKLMLDLMVKAVQCGRHDVITYLIDHEVGNGYRSHHSVSHYTEDSAHRPKLAAVDTWYVQQFAYLIGKLNSIQEGGSTALANSAVILGSGCGSDPRDDHSIYDVPMLLAGRAGGKLNPGRVLNKDGVPLTNFMLTVANKMGLSITSLGDSTGTVNDL